MKSLLLAKSNIRKNKGLSICILLLITIASMFICLSFILSNDYSKNANKEAKRLNTLIGHHPLLSYIFLELVHELFFRRLRLLLFPRDIE